MKLYDYDEAAAELRVSKTWLQRHIKELPRTKKGRVVHFTDEDLRRINEMFHLEPESGPLAAVAPVPVTTGGHPLAHLKPLSGRSVRSS
ncbi:MAG: helix-turn-helix domain-containing protein [Catenulispora sp.]|nr:helix-turn-helix domain-containing protein [Catenulispora sp.]